MENNLKQEDTCLTVEQAQELIKLGLKMEDTIFYLNKYTNQKNEDLFKLTNFKDFDGNISIHTFPTLTNSEMMEMLPKKINGWSLMISYEYDKWFVEYLTVQEIPITSETLFRDALFEMLKYLKTNNFI